MQTMLVVLSWQHVLTLWLIIWGDQSYFYLQTTAAKSKKNALLIDDGEGVEGVVGSIPFPNPTEALHHVWNHILRYRGVDIVGGAPYYVVNPDGSMTQGAGEAIAKNCWNPFVKESYCEGLQGMLMQNSMQIYRTLLSKDSLIKKQLLKMKFHMFEIQISQTKK